MEKLKSKPLRELINYLLKMIERWKNSKGNNSEKVDSDLNQLFDVLRHVNIKENKQFNDFFTCDNIENTKNNFKSTFYDMIVTMSENVQTLRDLQVTKKNLYVNIDDDLIERIRLLELDLREKIEEANNLLVRLYDVARNENCSEKFNKYLSEQKSFIDINKRWYDDIPPSQKWYDDIQPSQKWYDDIQPSQKWYDDIPPSYPPPPPPPSYLPPPPPQEGGKRKTKTRCINKRRKTIRKF